MTKGDDYWFRLFLQWTSLLATVCGALSLFLMLQPVPLITGVDLVHPRITRRLWNCTRTIACLFFLLKGLNKNDPMSRCDLTTPLYTILRVLGSPPHQVLQNAFSTFRPFCALAMVSLIWWFQLKFESKCISSYFTTVFCGMMMPSITTFPSSLVLRQPRPKRSDSHVL